MRAKVIQQDPVVEEEVVLRIGDVQLTTFVEICPNPICVGGVYPVELVAVCLDDPALELLSEEEEAIEHLGGYRYRLSGRLDGDLLECLGLKIDVGDCIDEGLPQGSYVRLTADRLSASFS